MGEVSLEKMRKIGEKERDRLEEGGAGAVSSEVGVGQSGVTRDVVFDLHDSNQSFLRVQS